MCQPTPSRRLCSPEQLLEYVREWLLSHSLVRLLFCWSVGTDALVLQTHQALLHSSEEILSCFSTNDASRVIQESTSPAATFRDWSHTDEHPDLDFLPPSSGMALLIILI